MTALHAEPTVEQLEAANHHRIEQHNIHRRPVMGVDEQYMILLLEELLGPERVLEVKRAHHAKLALELDRMDSIIRRGVLTAPPQQGAL